MSHHVATLQSAFDKTASVLNFVYALTDRLYWLDNNYVQPFYSWAAPRLREAAINGLYWALVTLIDVSLWLIDTTRQFFARDAQAIALVAFAHIHEPLPELPALCPAQVPLALPLMASGRCLLLLALTYWLALWLLGWLYAPLRCRWLSAYILTPTMRFTSG